MTETENHLLESGQMLTNVHPRLECIGEWCPIHRPMPGPWSNWPRLWRDDRGIMERVCPCGIGHPVAEMYQWALENGQGFNLVHGCCLPHICSPRVAKRVLGKADRIAIPDAVPRNNPAFDVQANVDLITEAVHLLLELEPDSAHASVVLETHQWQRVKRVLSQIPGLVARSK
jgi:hypothetical protein